ncbi:MAG: type I methionyl aminopeptidase [Puniceicoccales bacterium]|jgi:methionyl aminopeptidase|nr:type I methionyl aminopeptidase [Puniceicoccales bacterium]
MIPIKSPAEIEKMRHAGAISAIVLDEVCRHVAAGVSTADLDDLTRDAMRRHGAESTTLGFRSEKRIFPGHGCFSINDEIVHGLPSKKKILAEGDIISIDLAMRVDGFVGDNTRTLTVGTVRAEVLHLIAVTQKALEAGINAAVSGNHVGHISAAIQRLADENGFGVVRELVGHGIGREMHEEPAVPNYGIAGYGPELRPGMTLAIEPMFTLGVPKIVVDPDGWTIRTADGKWSAHCEHTVLITDNLPEVLTLLKN